MKSLHEVTALAEDADANMACRFILGRRPLRANELEALQGRPLAEMLLHLLRSAEFLEKVLPRLHAGQATMRAAAQVPVDPQLSAWLRQVLGLVNPQHWPEALAGWLRHPPNLAALARHDAALAKALGRAAAPSMDWRAVLPQLLCGPATALPVTEGSCLAAARQMILSPVWADSVLAPLAAGKWPALALTAACRALASAHFWREGDDKAREDDWAGLLLRLLGERQSRLCLEAASDWFECTPGLEASLPRLISLRNQAATLGPAPLPATPHRELPRAHALAQAGEMSEALRLLRRITEQSPGSSECWLLLAELLATTGHLPDAFAALGQARPDDASRLLAARMAIRAGRPSEAAEHLAAVAPEAPERLELLSPGPSGPLRLALIFTPPDALARALADDPLAPLAEPALRGREYLLHPALARLPPAPGAPHPLLCALARIAGDAHAAQRFAQAALAQRPDDAPTLLLLALAMRQAGNHHGAADTLDCLLEAQPEHEQAVERRLTYELDLCRVDPLRPMARMQALLAQRRIALNRKLASDPKVPALRLEHARLAIAAGETAEARVTLEALATERPGWAPPIAALMYLAQEEQDHAAVLAAWSRLPEAERGQRAVVAAAKALRLSGEVEAAQALLAEHLPRGLPDVRREHARNHFFAGRFAQAAQEANSWLEATRPDPELGLLAMAVALEQHDTPAAHRHAARLEAAGAERVFPNEFPLFRGAALTQSGDWEAGLAALDPMFARYGARPIRRDPRLGGAALDQLRGLGAASNLPSLDGPKISVVMTSFNSAAYVATAIRSILEQSYRNLELIIVDDASTDATPALLNTIQRQDPRVRVILKSSNDGTYVSKNIGLMHSTGEFVALQDSDDWSHPDRLACSADPLLRRPDLMGLSTDWLRMTSDGEIMIKAGGQISHNCCISLMFRRAPVMERMGFFDSVRIAADLEFLQRMSLVFGERAVPRLRWPLMVGRARADSLTAHAQFGLVRTGFTSIRAAYHRSADAWHAEIRGGTAEALMPFPLTTRRFEAHPAILPGAQRAEPYNS